MKSIIYLILLLPITIYSSPAWQRKVINYERAQYKAGFQNWMIDQTENGWIYTANTHGLLEFDGVNWSLYSAQSTVLRSVKAIGNRIYIGGSSEFGYFEPNNIGLLTYKSLSEKTKDWGGEVWNIINSENEIYFICDENVHILNKKNGNIASIYSSAKIECSSLFEGKLYLGSTNGIFYLSKNNTLEFFLPSEQLKNRKLVSILPYGNKLLVTTARDGLYFIENSNIIKVQSIADNFINNNQLFSTSLSGKKIALGSVQNGIFIFDIDNPSYKETFNLNNGLKNNTVLCSFFDRDRNLWLGLDKGISYIDLNSPIQPLFATVSPIGTGYCSGRYNNEIYLGTNQGLYKLKNEGGHQLIKGSEGQIWSIKIIDNLLFCSGDNGITIISPSDIYKINLPGVWEVRTLGGDSNRLIAATYSHFCILEKKNGRWYFSLQIEDFNDSTRGFIEDDENYSFWIANSGYQIQKITFDQNFKTILNKKIYLLNGANFEGNPFFRKIDNNLIICSRNGIFQYSRITDSFDHYTQLESMLEGRKFYKYLTIDDLKNIWFISDKKLKFLAYTSGEYKSIYNLGLSDELIENYENISLLDSTTAIIAVDNAFMKINLSQKKDKTHILSPYIKKLTDNKNDSIISYGNSEKPIVLPYSLNSIRIYFGTTNFQQTSDILYSYRLKGEDEEWSTPSLNTFKEYTNLAEGEYTFEVKTITENNIDSSKITSIKFTIIPPWYRSPLAYIFYFLLVVLLVFLLYKKTISKQKKIIYQKGEELIAQNKRHEEENLIKDQEIYELQNENLKTELRYKTQELNGYILNVIRKNEILEDVKRNALNISKAIDEEKQLSIVKQKVMRLINQINSNIEQDDDFEIFKSNFDLIHKDFFKLLDEKFPGLGRNEKILCAYLNMNLSSKEIAPLLNISVRGVEVNRYRLRKKMNLDRDINLSEYLQSLK